MINGVIEKLSQENAMIIADTWKYDDIYCFYDMTNDIEDYNEFISVEGRNDNYYQYMCNDELLGFFSLELDGDTITLGLGLKPDLTGKGNGKYLLEAIEKFIQLQYPSVTKVVLAVAEFNVRAINLYKHMGFIEYNRIMVDTNGSTYPFIQLSKNIK